MSCPFGPSAKTTIIQLFAQFVSFCRAHLPFVKILALRGEFGNLRGGRPILFSESANIYVWPHPPRTRQASSATGRREPSALRDSVRRSTGPKQTSFLLVFWLSAGYLLGRVKYQFFGYFRFQFPA
jgi:hypothetical protein